MHSLVWLVVEVVGDEQVLLTWGFPRRLDVSWGIFAEAESHKQGVSWESFLLEKEFSSGRVKCGQEGQGSQLGKVAITPGRG